MELVTFALIREGTSDDGLVPHIRRLLLRAGAREAIGSPRDYKGSVSSRVASTWAEPVPPDLVFVHRDSDSPDPAVRLAEIVEAASRHPGFEDRVVSVVPVQELEAWLLTDDREVRSVVGRPSGREPIGLPSIARIEATPSPKEVLAACLLVASDTRGRRRKRETERFSARRAALLDRLDIDGPVSELPSWKSFVAGLETAYNTLSLANQSVQGGDATRGPGT